MNPREIQTLCKAVAGELAAGDGTRLTNGVVSTDTRTVGEGDLFVALKGERFDAHDFLAEAAGKGAAALIVDRLPDGVAPGDAAGIKVPDTRLARRQRTRW